MLGNMSGGSTAILYCLGIMLASLAGGFLPLSRRLGHLTLQVYLSFSAGAMLGAAFFHMLPEAAEMAGKSFGMWTAAGVVGLYMIERFLSPHSHDTTRTAADGEEGSPHCRHDHHHDHVHESQSEHAAAPLVAGWSAVAGLFVHTVFGGVALAGALFGDNEVRGLSLGVFLATFFHKPADSLTISTLLVKGGVRRGKAVAVQVAFALVIPAVVAAFYFGHTPGAEFEMNRAWIGAVLGFSAGTFLCIALSDLLPEVQFHSHDRAKFFISLLSGVLLMWLTTFAEGEHAHGGGDAAPKAEQHEHP